MRCPLRCCDQSASSGTIDNVRRQDKGDVWSIRSIPLKRNLRQHPSYLNISYSNILISLFSAVSSLKNRKQNILFSLTHYVITRVIPVICIQISPEYRPREDRLSQRSASLVYVGSRARHSRDKGTTFLPSCTLYNTSVCHAIR